MTAPDNRAAPGARWLIEITAEATVIPARLVGEHGPELTHLPAGTVIHPARPSDDLPEEEDDLS